MLKFTLYVMADSTLQLCEDVIKFNGMETDSSDIQNYKSNQDFAR